VSEGHVHGESVHHDSEPKHRKSSKRSEYAKATAAAIGLLASIVAVLTYLDVIPVQGWWQIHKQAAHSTPLITPDAFILAAPDFPGYCSSLVHGNFHPVWGQDHQWHCTNKADAPAINLDAACQFSNHDRDAVASIAWFYTGRVDCWHATHSYGAPKIEAYCQHINMPDAVNSNGTVYGWSCTGNGSQAIYASAVCQWQLGNNQNTTAIFSDFNDEYSWRCWG
jgi:hypothetical protein